MEANLWQYANLLLQVYYELNYECKGRSFERVWILIFHLLLVLLATLVSSPFSYKHRNLIQATLYQVIVVFMHIRTNRMLIYGQKSRRKLMHLRKGKRMPTGQSTLDALFLALTSTKNFVSILQSQMESKMRAKKISRKINILTSTVRASTKRVK